VSYGVTVTSAACCDGANVRMTLVITRSSSIADVNTTQRPNLSTSTTAVLRFNSYPHVQVTAVTKIPDPIQRYLIYFMRT